MKNIAILIPTLKAGGAEKQAVLLSSLLSRNNDVHVIILAGEQNVAFAKNVEIIENSNVKLHKLTGGIKGKYKALKSLLKDNNIDILFQSHNGCG